MLQWMERGGKDNLKEKQIKQQVEKISKMEEVSEMITTNMQGVEITSKENTQNIQLIIPENIENLHKFIALKARKGSEIYTLNDEGVIITEKLANLLELKEGDNITIKNTDDIEVETKITNITENYLMHYMYMSPKLYKQLYGEEYKANSILVNMGLVDFLNDTV